MDPMSVTGVILAAGFGTRLRPSTEVCPKPLIPVAGVEPLFFAINKLQELGVTKVVVNAHYLADKISEAIQSWQALFPKMELRMSVENPKILGTGGAILKILKDHADLFEDSGLLLQNGDTLANFDLTELLKQPEGSTLAVSFKKDHLAKYKALWLEQRELNYMGIGPRAPASNATAAHFLGVHYLSPKAIQELSRLSLEVCECDLFNGIYRPLIDTGLSFKGIEFFKQDSATDFWFDMTNTEFLLEAQRYILDSMSANQIWPEVLRARYPRIREIEPGIWVLSRSQHLKSHRYYSPAVLVENETSSSIRELGPFSLGPHASLIHTKGQIVTKTEHGELEIRDSVVLLSSEQRAPLPGKIHGEVRVI